MAKVIRMEDSPATARRSAAQVNAIKCLAAGMTKAQKCQLLAAMAKCIINHPESAAVPGLRETMKREIARFEALANA